MKNLKENIKTRQLRLKVRGGLTAQVKLNSNAIQQNKKESEELSKEYETASKVALELGVNVDELMKSLELGTTTTNQSTDAIIKNTEAKKQNAFETDFLSTVSNDYFNTLTEDILNGNATIEQQEQKLRDFQIKLLDNLLLDEQLSYEERVQLETQLNKLKLDNMKSEQGERKAQIDGMKQVGDQLINLAGQDEKYQKIREAGVKISAAAALANNMESLSLQAKSLSKDLALGFPQNIIAIASTLALLMSIRSNIKSLTMAKGGMIEEFANGGMVHGKSHAQGGEKFAVGGRVVELEGGEAVINKRSTAMFRNQLSAMNAAGGGVKFADGGMINQPSFSQQEFNVLGQNQMMGAMGGASKVVVVESDITSVQREVSVVESDAKI